MERITGIEQLRGVRCDVLGIGISNVPLIRLLVQAGASVTAYDKKTESALGETAAELRALGVSLSLDNPSFEGLSGEVIFRSPGIRPDIPAIARAVARGTILTSEMALFCASCPCPIYAITGSDGKTTTTTLTHLFLAEAKRREGKGRALVGGNIGHSLLPEVESMTEQDVAVLELSSFQLSDMTHAFTRAAVTNVTPNHLDWHTDMEEYVAAKKRAVNGCGVAVFNADNPETMAMACERGRDMLLFSSHKASVGEILPAGAVRSAALYLHGGAICYSDGRDEVRVLDVADILLPGIHNVENYMTAIALSYGDVPLEIYRDVAKRFGGVPHRLELVRELGGVRYYNSSIDSSPTRTAAALHALSGELVVICGGYDKGIPFAPLAEALCERAHTVVLTGATAEKIEASLQALAEQGVRLPYIMREPDFERAVRLAASVAVSGQSVLLSPACASFDAFANFMQRGEAFKRIVASLLS